MRNSTFFLWLSIALAACGSAQAGPDAAVGDGSADDAAVADAANGGQDDICTQEVAKTPTGQGCPGQTTYLYDPQNAQSTFPDDWYTIDDAKSLTGLRVKFDATSLPWLKNVPGTFASTYADLSTLDGWGVNAGIILRFDAALLALPSGPTSVDADVAQLWDLDAKPPVKVPFETEMVDDYATAILWPMRPLQPKHRHGVVVTDKAPTASGKCIRPSAVLNQLLYGNICDAKVQRLAPHYKDLLLAAHLAPEQVAAAVVFTTQSTTEQSVAIAKDIKSRDFKWKVAPSCKTAAQFRVCSGSFSAGNYTNGRVVVNDKPQSQGDMQVAIWLPLSSTATNDNGPYPAVIFGHGLGSDRMQGEELAVKAATGGLATIAIDAVGHGEHPTANKKDAKIIKILKFFGVDMEALAVDGLALRDHWRQSTYDKLQLIRLLQQHNDIDGDGKADLQMAKLMYLGVSLGGIMGPELLATSGDIPLAVLAVPGGRVSSIISDGSIFSSIAVVMQNALNVTDSDVKRFYPVLQTLMDAGDAASYGPYILGNRLPGAGDKGVSVLAQMVINDEYVPNAANRALMRAMNIPVMTPILQPIGLIPAAPAAPFSANVSAKLTAAVLQFDRVTREVGQAPVVAEHGNAPGCLEALLQDMHFMQTWLDKGVPEILNPYEVMQTKPLAKLP